MNRVALGLDPAPPKPEPRILGIDIENRPRWGFTDSYVHDELMTVAFRSVSLTVPIIPFDPRRLVLDSELYIAMEPHAVEDVTYIELDWREGDTVVRAKLEPLWEAYEDATAVLGHNFRHDFKLLSGTKAELLMQRLEKKPFIDTMHAIPSGPFRGLDSLAWRHALGLKPHLSPQGWTDCFNRRDRKARRLVKYRNQIDVVITERLYWLEKGHGLL